MKIIVGVTGSSGVRLAHLFLQLLPKYVEAFVVVSENAKKSFALETGKEFCFENQSNIIEYDDNNIGAPIASGSFLVDAMIVLPCSMNTLAKLRVGISDTLITRAFSVCLKERRAITIVPREMPLNTIQLENMTYLSTIGVSVSPPVLGYYSNQQTLQQMESFLVGKWFDSLKIEHNIYKRWGEHE